MIARLLRALTLPLREISLRVHVWSARNDIRAAEAQLRHATDDVAHLPRQIEVYRKAEEALSVALMAMASDHDLIERRVVPAIGVLFLVALACGAFE